ncbi:MAG: Na+/H+ antiporter subunit E [Gemmatimonadota bacterium]|nr:Na+/H+ antiporter subunit E [Gemmatimonadota bacterium]MDH3422147.1 Na+/H+ antiporter subunit E [Gemmatimonadota bacterium]
MSRLQAIALRAAVLALAWYVVSAGDPRSWVVGVPAVLVTAGLQLADRSQPLLRWWRLDHLARFALFYVGHAIAGGVDVSARALLPGRRVHPDFVTYRLRLPHGPARSLLVVTISMLPGTVAAHVAGRKMVVQRIHSGIDAASGCRRTEEHVARLFGIDLAPQTTRRED